MPATPRPAPSPRPPGTAGRLAGPQIGALVAFAGAAIATFLPWISAGGVDFSSWDEGARFRFGDWLSLDKGDAYVIILVALLGAVSVIGPVVSRSVPKIQFAPAAVGAAILVIAGLEWQFIDSEGAGLDPAFGIYVLGAAGIAAAVLGYIGDKALPRR